jgi:hypothetical protein
LWWTIVVMEMHTSLSTAEIANLIRLTGLF